MKSTRVKVFLAATTLTFVAYFYVHPVSSLWLPFGSEQSPSSGGSSTTARQLAADPIIFTNDTQATTDVDSNASDGPTTAMDDVPSKVPPSEEGGTEEVVSTKVESKLLVIVLAGGDRMRYRMHRAIWRMMADIVESWGVHIYLVGVNPQLPREIYNKEHRSIVFPGVDGNIPGCLRATVKGIDYVYTNKLPGHDAPHVLRTNMSSFFVFKLLLEWLSLRPSTHLYASVRLHDHNVDYASGAGMVLSRDLVVTMLEEREKLDWGEWDDIAIGKFMIIGHNITLISMPRCNMYVESPIELQMQPPLYCRRGPEWGMDFHYRVKSAKPMQDMYVFSMLFVHHYGPSQFILPQSAFFYTPVTPNAEELNQLQG